MVTSSGGVRQVRLAFAWAATAVVLAVAACGTPPAMAQSSIAAADQAQGDPFAARQQAWDRARKPSLPTAGPDVGRGPNENFSPPPSCESSCSVESARCFAACPGGAALDRAAPRLAGRNPAVAQCQESCLTAESACTVSCGKSRLWPATSPGTPTPRTDVRNLLPPSPPTPAPLPPPPGPPGGGATKEASISPSADTTATPSASPSN